MRRPDDKDSMDTSMTGSLDDATGKCPTLSVKSAFQHFGHHISAGALLISRHYLITRLHQWAAFLLDGRVLTAVVDRALSFSMASALSIEVYFF